MLGEARRAWGMCSWWHDQQLCFMLPLHPPCPLSSKRAAQKGQGLTPLHPDCPKVAQINMVYQTAAAVSECIFSSPACWSTGLDWRLGSSVHYLGHPSQNVTDLLPTCLPVVLNGLSPKPEEARLATKHHPFVTFPCHHIMHRELANAAWISGGETMTMKPIMSVRQLRP